MSAPAFTGAFDDFGIPPYRSGPASSPRRSPLSVVSSGPRDGRACADDGTVASTRARHFRAHSTTCGPTFGLISADFEDEHNKIARTSIGPSPQSVAFGWRVLLNGLHMPLRLRAISTSLRFR